MRFILISVLAFSALVNSGQQDRTPAAAPQATLRSTSQEVLLDVVVRDKKGHLVKGLTANDFELTDDGARQTIRSFRQVIGPETPPEAPASGAAASTTTRVAEEKAAALDPFKQVRIITLAFDRLGPDARNIARKAVEDLLKTEGGPNLFFAVFYIDQNLSIVQPYTTNKDLVWKAVARVTASPSTLYKSEEDQIVAPAALSGAAATATSGPAAGGPAADAFALMMHDMAQFNEDVERPLRSRATLNALEALIPPQYRLPGRKTLMYFCEGINIAPEYVDEFHALISSANRANVSVYGIDARGLNSMSQTAGGASLLSGALAAHASQQAAHSGAVTRDQATGIDHALASIQANTQNSLEELSQKTGGFMIANTNDLRPGLHRVAEDLDTHYEIAYSPQILTFDGHFRQIAVTVKRPDARVQTRDGYYALPFLPGQSVMPFEVPMLSALAGATLPRDIVFRSSGLHFRSSTGEPLGVVVFDVPLNGIEFTKDQGKQLYQVHFSVLALLKDAQGSVVRKFSQDVPRQGPLATLNGFRAGHFIYSQYTPLAPGRYTLETVVSDRITGKISARKSSVLIPPVTDGVGISSLVRVRSVFPKDADAVRADDPFQVAAEKISPGLEEDAKAGSGAVSFFFTVYAKSGDQAIPGLNIEFFQDGQRVGHAEPKLQAPDIRGIIPYIASTPLDSFKPGQYELRVTVSQDGKAATERTLVTIE
jgi:VWFA-related protein